MIEKSFVSLESAPKKWDSRINIFSLPLISMGYTSIQKYLPFISSTFSNIIIWLCGVSLMPSATATVNSTGR
jgi:uncharacterized membrane protein